MPSPRPKGATGAGGRGLDKFAYVRQVMQPPHTTAVGLAEFRALIALWDYTDGAGRRARPGVERLARQLGYGHTRPVERLLASLTAKGYLVVESVGGGAGRATSYALAVPQDPEAHPTDDWAQPHNNPGQDSRGSDSDNPDQDSRGSGPENPGHNGRGLAAKPRPTRSQNPGQDGPKTPAATAGASNQEQTTDQSAPHEPPPSATPSARTAADVWVDEIAQNNDVVTTSPDQLEAERARQLDALTALTQGAEHAHAR